MKQNLWPLKLSRSIESNPTCKRKSSFMFRNCIVLVLKRVNFNISIFITYYLTVKGQIHWMDCFSSHLVSCVACILMYSRHVFLFIHLCISFIYLFFVLSLYKRLNHCFSTIYSLYSGFFGLPHLLAISRLVGYLGIALIVEEMLKTVERIASLFITNLLIK